ncbi:nucleoside recognition domain-containing protein [Desulforamulus aquiferis]|uniref:Nucleoside recognition domain-containing protein n=1 Tax=Desulforamulus aquiferis TaxID=1397668 RepID=A0AAW7Z9K3_9FIRM|nr:nucleoside recognition domain-containing protein [Desulforamulus aquiferis]MDO7785953.1 nucleoside recognition domain-containing protein [Desulforamulus aquiferis]RYD02042.1 nucleoside recognition protein [Desulforamulus aquiferis]
MVTVDTFKRGLNKGLSTTWTLSKVVVPIYVAVTFLSFTPLLGKIASLGSPFMKWVGLPGEAALAIVMGNVLNLYAALGVMASLSLDSRETTIISMMLLLSHTIFIESAVAAKCGINPWLIGGGRFILCLISGVVLNIIL